MNLKQLLFTLAFVCGASVATAQVKQVTIDGKTYYGTKAIPPELEGKYLYYKEKEPIVEIVKGGTGWFQVHDVPAYPVEFWIETDAKGNVQKRKSETNNNYQVVLIVLYGDNQQPGWKGANKNTYTRIEATVAYDQGYVIILGERFKPIR